MTGKDSKETLNGTEREANQSSALDRRGWRNWFLFVAVAVVTTIGLATAILTLLGEQVEKVWPWAKTDLVLLAGLSIAILLFAGYLTEQQRQVVALRRELLQTQRDANARLRRTYDRLVALLNVSRVLATESNAQTVFDSITQTCMATFDCEQASLMLLNAQSGVLDVASVSGHDTTAETLTRSQKIGAGPAGWVARERRAIVLNGDDQTAAYPGLDAVDDLPARGMVAPIVMRGELVGVLSISSGSVSVRYNDEDLQAFLLFAESVGICCRHSEQTNWMRQTIQRLDAALQDKGLEGDRRAA